MTVAIDGRHTLHQGEVAVLRAAECSMTMIRRRGSAPAPARTGRGRGAMSCALRAAPYSRRKAARFVIEVRANGSNHSRAHAEYDAELDLMRSANRTPARPMGIQPEPFDLAKHPSHYPPVMAGPLTKGAAAIKSCSPSPPAKPAERPGWARLEWE